MGTKSKTGAVLKAGISATEEDIQEYCRQNLAAHKVPKVIEFREQLPVSSMLKLLRRVLRDEELAKMQE